MEAVIKREFLLAGLCCANCAAKIEREAGKISGVSRAVLDFAGQRLTVELAAPPAADVAAQTDKPSKLVDAIRIARQTVRIARQNIVFALGVKAVILVLGALGLASMWAAVFGDVGVTFIAVLNAMRALRA
ncbi:MAG: heavy metal translocating P-type ATPase [Gracilibacteraceae bacterium]|jgi:cation transport ATPase|nr:heavy metal translocating P-type ATPase [Gracilibacteraceae bacterium]